MYELTGKITNLALELGSEKAVLTLTLNEKRDALACNNELRGAEKLTVKIGKYREKRSLDANAYCFVLIGKLAEKLQISPVEVYRKAIKEIGGNYDVVCVKDEAVEKLRQGWETHGLGWQSDTLPSKIKGCTNVILYYGSSTYDTKQMSLLIEHIVEECKAQGIETKTPLELAALIDMWGGSKNETV